MPPGLLFVAKPLFAVANGTGIRFDCPLPELLAVRRAVSRALLSRPVRWSDPLRSPGSTSTAARVYFTGYFPPGELTGLDVSMLIANLRAVHVPLHTMIAAEKMFSDNGVMLLEVMDPAAALKVAPLCSEMAFVTPRLLTVSLLTAPTLWEDPTCFVAKLRWRRSRNGGRVIAQPAATQRQLQASHRVATAAAATQHTAEVSVCGSVGHDGRQLALLIVEVLQGVGVQLAEAPSTATTASGMWQSITSCTAEGPSGRLRLHLSTASEAQLVRRTLHDRAFQHGPDLVSLAVFDDASLDAQTKNGRRGARRRAGPSAATASAQ